MGSRHEDGCPETPQSLIKGVRPLVSYAVSAPPQAQLDITGSDEKFPVRRIYCIGKNYVAHIREMNADERDPPAS